MSQTYEEEIASWAAAWVIAETNHQEAAQEYDRAKDGYEKTREFRNSTSRKLMECVGRNTLRRCVQLVDGRIVLIDFNHGISFLDPIRQATP